MKPYDAHIAALDQIIPWLRKGILPNQAECIRLADELGRTRDTLQSNKAYELRKIDRKFEGRTVNVGTQKI